MKKYLNILYTLLFILIQVTIISKFLIFGYNCNLALVCVIIVAALADTNVSVINAVLAGILFDVFNCYNVGWHLIMFTIIALLMVLIVKYMYHGSLISVALLTAILTIITELILFNFGYEVKQNYASYAFLKFILPQTIINTFSALLLFPIFKKINRKKNEYKI